MKHPVNTTVYIYSHFQSLNVLLQVVAYNIKGFRSSCFTPDCSEWPGVITFFCYPNVL